jgi:FdhD protein
MESADGAVYGFAMPNRCCTAFRDNRLRAVEYPLALEDRLEILVDGHLRGATMRSPGDDIHLAAGFCFTEGIIGSFDEIDSVDNFQTACGVSQTRIELRKYR